MEHDHSLSGTSRNYLDAPSRPHGRMTFEGLVRVLSVSSIGEIDGLVLEDGSFIQIPPHSLIEGLSLKNGDFVTGEGEVVLDVPHRIYRFATLFKGEILVANDNIPEAERADLIERHRHAEKDLFYQIGDDFPHRQLEDFEGTLMSVNIKSIGEVERLIFENQSSVHLPEDLHLALGDVKIGEYLHVRGRSSQFGEARFILAQRITTDAGEIFHSSI